MDFRREDLQDLAGRVRRGELSARELTDTALARIEAVNPQVNAFVAVDADGARAQAAALDEQVAAGEPIGPLAGIPIGVKDLEDAAGFVTTLGSALRADDAPAGADSVLVARLRAAGCVVLGKTNTPEMGCKGDTVNVPFGATRNPWNLDRSAGGSSGGSAAAVASGMVPLCTGSDGGGSIRIPAAMCGLTGFKPSLGRVPAGGGTPPAWADLSTKGVMARTAAETAFALDAVIGPEPTDLRSLPHPGLSWRDGLDDLHLPARVAWSPDLGFAPVDDEVATICAGAVERLARAGVEVAEEPSVFSVDPVQAWLVLTSAGNLGQVAELRGTPDWDRLDPLVRMTAEYAATKLAAVDVVAANDAAHQMNLVLVSIFQEASLLLCPTVAAQAPAPDGLGTVNGVEDPNWVRFTYPFNLTRSPAGTLPVGHTSDGVPVGLQVVGPQHADAAVLRALASFEQVLGPPPVCPVEP